MNVPGKRLILGTAVAAAALGVGGIAYATTGDPAPEQGYVTIEDGATTPSPGTGSAQRDGTDCPEKNGGQGQNQGQGQQGEQPAQPEQTQPDASENA
ncbi:MULTISPECIES: hypothetical protein [unclassified Kribbella]|uniref:hypothetical protein n=1 Tax=unclassified Kribbella TaxID=2644121 RepID=UPI0033ECB308